ncbi:GDSL esterase/lipase [Hibiscus syriacus]|uniref:GDSL esterase/lipase n=1 Tax=Hibiscus syriacus TaxID=106335 RepID=A0A6A2XBQ3_HIBSY|nr:GDSL esterase/lipase [Hibiscus syriacus]
MASANGGDTSFISLGSGGDGKRLGLETLTGEILIVMDLDLKFLRKNIRAVSQEPSLFSSTIEDNIKVGNIDASDQQIRAATTMANAHTFVSQLLNQYLTEVGQRGLQLSGGQKQRIAIARAVLKNPLILLLNEATSALDTESEKLVQDALEKAMQGRTVILIGHRMSTIPQAISTTNCSVFRTSGEFTSQGRATEITEESVTTDKHISSLDIEQKEETRELGRHLTESFEQIEHQRMKKTITFFRIWFGLSKRDVAKIATGSIAAAFVGVSKPFFGFFIITVGVGYYEKDAKQLVGKYSIIFAVIGLLALFLHTLQHYFYGVVRETAMANLRKALYSGVLRNEVPWIEKPENNCISSILIVSMVVNWRMGLVAWAVMPCHFIGGLIQAKSAKGFAGDSAAIHREVVALVSESAANIRTIASFFQEEHILRKARIAMEKPMKRSRKESIKYGIIQGFSLCLWNIAHAVALWYTTILVDRRQASFENGIRSYQIFSLTVPSITELWTLIPSVISAINVLTPAFETIDCKTEIELEKPKDSQLERIKGKIEFDNVKLNYPLRPEVTVLNNFSLRIESGTKVALVGPSGAGKSSVLAILLMFYVPLEGKVLIDDKNIEEYNLKMLRRQIGLVQQEPFCSVHPLETTYVTEPNKPPKPKSSRYRDKQTYTNSLATCPMVTTRSLAKKGVNFWVDKSRGSLLLELYLEACSIAYG